VGDRASFNRTLSDIVSVLVADLVDAAVMVDSCYCGGFRQLLPVAAVPTAVVAVAVVVLALSRTATVMDAKLFMIQAIGKAQKVVC
jgi:hypothetical protein